MENSRGTFDGAKHTTEGGLFSLNFQRTVTPYSDSGGTTVESINLDASFTYDNEGRMTGEQYPSWVDQYGDNNPGPNLAYTFDSMGRLSTLTEENASLNVISGTAYGPANELTQIYAGGSGGWGGETRTFNSLKQLTSITSSAVNMQYHFPSTNNNGKIDYQIDNNLSGEQVNYTYDTLNRLITASVSNQGWSQSFAYDGFGNLDTVTGTDGFSTSYNTSTNQPTICADLNGNTLSMSTVGQTGCYSSSLYTYNVENRIAVVPGGTGAMSYSYSPGNKRVWRGSWTGSYGSFTPVTDEVTFWSVTGQKLASYQITFVQSPGYPTPPLFYVTPTGTNYYFGGKLIKNGNGNNWVYTDRLGSVGKYYPYGQDKGSSNPSSGEKFTGYFRDAETGNDYAVNRYIAPSSGRFMTPDPSGARASSPASPQSWNMYAYALGDPVNYRDPRGLEIVDGVDGDDGYDCTDDDFICISTGAGDGSAGFAADPTSSVGSKVALYNLRQMLAGLASAMLPLNEGEVGPGGPVPFYLYVASECWSPGVQGGGTLAYTLEVTYQVENQFGQPMSGAQLSGYYVAESLSNITGNVGGLSPGIWSTGPNAATPQSGTINPQGQLTDLLSAGGFPPLINLSGSSFQSFSAYGPGPVYQPLTVLGFGSPTTVLSDTYGPNNVSVNGAYFGSNPAPKCP